MELQMCGGVEGGCAKKVRQLLLSRAVVCWFRYVLPAVARRDSFSSQSKIRQPTLILRPALGWWVLTYRHLENAPQQKPPGGRDPPFLDNTARHQQTGIVGEQAKWISESIHHHQNARPMQASAYPARDRRPIPTRSLLD